MKLPNYKQAEIPEAKTTRYLLLETSEEGKGKAAFFRQFGFSMAEWQRLAEALLTHAADYEVRQMVTTEHGVKYIIDGELFSPDERRPVIRCVWIIEHGKTTTRFVTAYPLKGISR